MNYLEFLRKKTQGYSLHLAFRLEFESFVFGVLGLIPTTFGVLIRGIALKIFCKKCSGFAWIQPRVIFVHTERIKVGRLFGVNSNTYINGVGGVEIGNYVLLGSNVTIASGVHPILGVNPPIITRQSIPKKIVIEDDVWIGSNAVIMPGVKIARGTVVGANSVVTKNTLPYTVMAGSPARIINRRDIDS